MASITQLVRGLLREGLLVERGSTDSPRGRKQVLLRLNAQSRVALGVEYDADHVTAVAVDLRANVLARRRVKFARNQSRVPMLKSITGTIAGLLAGPECRRARIIGIGVADPGIVDTRRGVSLFSTTVRDWHDVPVEQLLRRRFAVPVHVEESLRARTLCEKRYGAARESNNLMFIDINLGVGCGLVLNGALFYGATESAGEFGHMRVVENGVACRCGGTGCLETVASFPGIVRRRGVKGLTAADVFTAAVQGDRPARKVVDETVHYLAVAVANVVNLLNPEMVIVNCELPHADELLVTPLRELIGRQAMKESVRRLRVERSQLGEEAGARGAAAFVLDRVFEIPALSVPEKLRQNRP